ncbi:MAG TPA: ABC transporter permease [Rhodanobacteraceae bacterium]|nr:ABC transporter permease [Rhodanobacteraceae bacterium]
MIRYYLALGLRSWKRNPFLMALMVIMIGVGVAATMTTIAALRAVSGDPVPGKSRTLFVPQIDNQGPSANFGSGEPPPSLSYIDAMAILHSNAAPRTALAAPFRTAIIPRDATRPPIPATGYATTPEFFTMFDVPFRFGGGWPAADAASNVVVIGERLNRVIFHDRNSVGRTLDLGGHAYRIAGVLGAWNPQPRFYAGADVNDLTDHGEPPQLFMPLQTAVAQQIAGSAGSVMCPPDYHGTDWNAFIASECDWISAWVELPSTADVARYRHFLVAYSEEQQQLGRFHWPANVRLRDLPDWLASMHAVPQENRIAVLLAAGLQVVCMLNALGLLLAHFMRRRGEIGVRRALGAPRKAIVAQFLVEAALIGLAGAMLGVVLTILGVARIGDLFGARIARLAHVDGGLVGVTLLVAMMATLVVALLPILQAARVQPSQQLKAQ